MELSDENVDGADTEIYNSKAVLVPEPKSNDDLKNTLKGTDELIEVINPEAILTEIPDDFVENESDSETDNYSIVESAFDPSERPGIEETPDPNLGVTKIKWRITRTLKPKPPPPPPPRITSSNMDSLGYDPVLYGGENYESENERQEMFNETLETTISEEEDVFSDGSETGSPPVSDDYTVDVDDSVLEEESVLYTKPYIKLRVDWMW